MVSFLWRFLKGSSIRISGITLKPNLEQLPDFLLPSRLKNRRLVIDDIERGGHEFTVKELMGFIDEYKQNTQFLLIANTAKLNEAKAGENWWQILHEKVIDEEVQIDPPAADVFRIAYEEFLAKEEQDAG